MAFLTFTCKPGQTQGWILYPADQKWQSKTKMSVRQISAHQAYYLLTRFQLWSSELKTHSSDQYTQEFVDSKSWTLSPHAVVPGWPGQCCTWLGISLHSPQSQGKVAFTKRWKFKHTLQHFIQQCPETGSPPQGQHGPAVHCTNQTQGINRSLCQLQWSCKLERTELPASSGLEWRELAQAASWMKEQLS